MRNKRIKINPYPNLEITEDCISEINIDSNIKNISLDDTQILIADFSNGSRRVMRSNIVNNDNGESFISVSPNLVHLYIDNSLENFYKSEELKNISFSYCSLISNKKCGDHKLLDIDCDETHLCYNEFIKCKINSIIFLATAIEAFCNNIIPNDYIYISTETKCGKTLSKNRIKKKIEKEVKLYQKLDEIIPQFTSLDFWIDKVKERDNIKKIYSLRNDLIHLKTNSEDEMKVYSKVFGDVINIDIFDHIISIIGIFNKISNIKNGKDFVSFSSENYINKLDINKIDYIFLYLYFDMNENKLYKYIRRYKNISNTKIRKWKNDKLPKDFIEYFSNKEGQKINYFLSKINNKYYDRP